MSEYAADYKSKLASPEEAIGLIHNGATIMCGVNFSEPPALLTAIADRCRAGDLRDIDAYFFNPSPHAAKTLFAPDICDCVEPRAWFVSRAVKDMVRCGRSRPVRHPTSCSTWLSRTCVTF